MFNIPRADVWRWSERKKHPRGISLRSLIINIYPGAVFGADGSVNENTPGGFSLRSLITNIFPGAVFSVDGQVKRNTAREFSFVPCRITGRIG